MGEINASIGMNVSQPDFRWRGAIWMWLLLGLFVLRVVGQMLVAFFRVSFLPPMGEWYSGLMSYPILLPVQWVIIALTGSLRAPEPTCRRLAGLVQRDLFRLDDRAIRNHDDSSSGATLATWHHSDLVSHGSGELPVPFFALPFVDGEVAR